MSKDGKADRRNTRLRFEQWARNPTCEANLVSAVTGISMVDVARAEGGNPTMGQSPFALSRGNQFERGLFRAGGRVIRDALAQASVIPSEDALFFDFRARRSGGRLATLDAAVRETEDLLSNLAHGNLDTKGADSAVVAAPAMVIPGGIMLPEAVLVLDVLVIRHDGPRPRLIVGEVKTYPDRGGHTDGAQLATARAQAGVYVHGLNLVLEQLGIEGLIDVQTSGFLVLTRPGYNVPSVRANEDFSYQARRAARGFARLHTAADSLKAHLPASVDHVLAASCAYDETCVSFCDRASLCRRRSLDAGDPRALGSDVSRFLNGIDLKRATAILGGEPPVTPAEQDLLRRVEAARSRSLP